MEIASLSKNIQTEKEDTMRYLLMFALLGIALAGYAFDCTQFGPTVDELWCADLQQEPLSFGGMSGGWSGIFIEENDQWAFYSNFPQYIPLWDIYKRDASTFMGLFGMGTYSDGLYNFDLNAHSWTIDEWFVWPHFIQKYPNTGRYYVGESMGLFDSFDGSEWNIVIGMGGADCYSLAWQDNHLVTNIGSSVRYSSDSGQTWQQSSMILLKGFRFAADGTLYGLMNAGSDSDGLWRSEDFGATWNVVFYTTGLCCIGPDFNGVLPLGWDQVNEVGCHAALVDSLGNLTPLNHPSLASAVREMEIFPLINTPSFYVINGDGCFYITGFINTAAEDETIPPVPEPALRVWPNPARSQLRIAIDRGSQEPVSLAFYDVKGRKVLSAAPVALRDGCLEQTLPPLPAGLYLLKVKQGPRVFLDRIVVCK